VDGIIRVVAKLHREVGLAFRVSSRETNQIIALDGGTQFIDVVCDCPAGKADTSGLLNHSALGRLVPSQTKDVSQFVVHRNSHKLGSSESEMVERRQAKVAEAGRNDEDDFVCMAGLLQLEQGLVNRVTRVGIAHPQIPEAAPLARSATGGKIP